MNLTSKKLKFNKNLPLYNYDQLTQERIKSSWLFHLLKASSRSTQKVNVFIQKKREMEILQLTLLIIFISLNLFYSFDFDAKISAPFIREYSTKKVLREKYIHKLRNIFCYQVCYSKKLRNLQMIKLRIFLNRKQILRFKF